MKGWLIAAGILGIGVLGVTKGCDFVLQHEEAQSSCYDNAKNVAGDRNVQLAMSDGYLTQYECDHAVTSALEEKDRKARVDDFMNLARAADNAQSQ